jgi:hypothetical protein
LSPSRRSTNNLLVSPSLHESTHIVLRLFIY